jgi:hypothetical protein
MKTVRVPAGANEPETVTTALLISSVRIEPTPGHDLVHVWNRGGKAGTLIVETGDGEQVARLLVPEEQAEVSSE